jgi:HAE1 family hydrophobic/amphiphilic exporter-1
MISGFFIDRPVAANVLAWLMVLLGLVSLYRLPVEQYPQISPPTIVVSTVYPGASATVVAETVATPIEQQVNGVEGMLYMSSTASADGAYALTVTFGVGTPLDIAQVLVQNRVAAAEPQLPEEVRRQGVTVKKQSTSIVMGIFLTSPDGRYSDLYLANFAALRLRDPLSRVAGVSDVVVRGVGSYSMRVWLDPEALRSRGLTAQDLARALAEQNVQVAAGQLGQSPAGEGRAFQVTLRGPGRLTDPREFERVVVKTGPNGRVVHLSDVARVELGSLTYDQFTSLNGKPATGILIYQLPDANALDVSTKVREAGGELARSLPPGIEVRFPCDTTKFVSSAISEVYRTLIEAGLLVLVVILVFLQSWRAVLIPMTTVPVTIIGAFAFMWALGFSVNLLTLLGLVLAIGIVVDDAIVIVENAAHHIDKGDAPREGTIKAMNEVTGPVIGITAVLMAVFVPTVFLTGITGRLYQQFALTIAATALISAINALTLKPAQSASWLRPSGEKTRFGRAFDRVFEKLQSLYVAALRFSLRSVPATVIALVLLLAVTGWVYRSVPTSFLPTEDQGYVIVNVQLPAGASLSRTRAVIAEVDGILRETKGIADWFSLGGFSLLDGAASPSNATIFAVFDDWEARKDPTLSQRAILGKLGKRFEAVQDAVIFAFPPPAIRGLGVANGFQMQIEDRGDVGMKALQEAVEAMTAEAGRRPGLGSASTTFRADVPQYRVDVDREKLKAMDVNLGDVFVTMQAALGSLYVNDFNKFGSIYQVRLQADQRFRMDPEDVGRLTVRNRQGGMVPLGSLVEVVRTVGPQLVTRYNMYPVASINGAAAPGASSGEALHAMERLAAELLPAELGYEWTAISYEEKRSSGQELGIFALSILLVYLVLAFLYESWLIPLAVILVVPIGVLGSALAVLARSLDNNIYTQIGVVIIIALASKNAILIVEFARELVAQGMKPREAAIEAARQRFRPILMTSFAFILGVLPLVWATGAAAASRQALGTAVVGGMITSTVVSIAFVPALFVALSRLTTR